MPSHPSSRCELVTVTHIGVASAGVEGGEVTYLICDNASAEIAV